MVLTRALLSASTLDDAVKVLTKHLAAGGFHLTLAQTNFVQSRKSKKSGETRLLSVEFGGEGLSVKEIETAAIHTNHALHLKTAMDSGTITDSSRDRLFRGNELIAQQQFNPLEILRDKGGKGLPIRRDLPDDPDDENTLATVVFNLSASGVEWSIYDTVCEKPAFQGEWKSV